MPYGRHVGVVSSEYDNAFKQIITAGWAEKTDGAVDEMGHVAMIPIPANERDELVAAVFEDGTEENIPGPGYYISSENSDGIITVYSYETRWEMEADWENWQSEYLHWLGQCDEEGC